MQLKAPCKDCVMNPWEIAVGTMKSHDRHFIDGSLGEAEVELEADLLTVIPLVLGSTVLNPWNSGLRNSKGHLPGTSRQQDT